LNNWLTENLSRISPVNQQNFKKSIEAEKQGVGSGDSTKDKLQR